MAETYGVEFVNEGVTLDVAADESILDAGELMGLSLPYRCRMGVCGVCCARREGDGEVDQTEGMFLSPEEQRAGYVLTCVGKPRSDLRLLTDSSP
jgi:ferredoxin